MIRKIILLLTILSLFLLTVPVFADQLVLPSALSVIDEQAFEGDTSLDEVILPYGIINIGSRAFADSSVTKITLPGSLTYIAPDAFEGVDNLSIAAGERSYAFNWAKDNGFFISRTIARTDNVSVKLEADQLVINVRGISQADKEAFIRSIEDSILDSLLYRTSFTVQGNDLVDAEKFSLEIGNYDAQLCWAATAANMLWISGYAEQVVNPATGIAFASVDEVFDYFRKQFSDQVGRPDGALSLFFSGEYPFTDEAGWSQLRNPNNTTALMPEVTDENYGAYWAEKSGEKLDLLDNLMSVSAGVLLRGVLYEGNGIYKYDEDFAHWVTAVGVIINPDVTDLADRYKAILIANSDNNPNNLLVEIPNEEKAIRAANAINTYTIYPLYLFDFGESFGKRWTIPYGGTNSCTIIDWLAYLKD